jgi:hypothetical protein
VENFDDIISAAEMDEQIERLASTENGCLPSDTPEMKVIQALHGYYRSDVQDLRSVDLVWKRLVQRMSAPDVLEEEYARQSQDALLDIPRGLGSDNVSHNTRQRIRSQRLNAFIMLAVAILLVGSTASVFYLARPYTNGATVRPKSTTVTMGAPTRTSEASTRLGTSVEGIALGMNHNQVLAVLSKKGITKKSITEKSIAKASLNEFVDNSFANGLLDITFVSHSSSYIVESISVSLLPSSSVPAATAEGFRLGESYTTMCELYKQFLIKRSNLAKNMQAEGGMYTALITDQYGTTLQVTFNAQNSATQIVLQQSYK